MTKADLKHMFGAVWLVDYEYHQPDGHRPTPLCLVAKELFSGRFISVWNPDAPVPPYGIGPSDLFVSYYSVGDLTCHIVKGWPMPTHNIDLYAEFRRHVCGIEIPGQCSLLGGLTFFGLPGIECAVKEEMRDLAKRGGTYTAEERAALLRYCESDVIALERLFWRMLPEIDLPRALIRGRYVAALARVEWRGIPLDLERYRILMTHWQTVRLELIARIDGAYGVYDGEVFKRERFHQWLTTRGIEWPFLKTGALALDEDTFADMAKIYPAVQPLKELRTTLSQLRLNELGVGPDGRNRCMLSPFASRTGRNQPSTSRYIFGQPVWFRSLIRPAPGRAIAYCDYEQQEFAIAAYLSGDEQMMEAYRSGDPYLAFAKQAGAVPQDATKQSHKAQRDLFKTCALGVQYGMAEAALGFKIGLSPAHGHELIQKHRRTYPQYWQWSEAVQDHAMFNGRLHTAFGWQVRVGKNPNPRSLRNFPIQANGSEMLRFTIILAEQRGVEVCAPVHDALLIEAEESEIDAAVEACQEVMAKASELVLPGFALRTDAKIVRFPQRYIDERGELLWKEIWSIPALRDSPPSGELPPV